MSTFSCRVQSSIWHRGDPCVRLKASRVGKGEPLCHFPISQLCFSVKPLFFSSALRVTSPWFSMWSPTFFFSFFYFFFSDAVVAVVATLCFSDCLSGRRQEILVTLSAAAPVLLSSCNDVGGLWWQEVRNWATGKVRKIGQCLCPGWAGDPAEAICFLPF